MRLLASPSRVLLAVSFLLGATLCAAVVAPPLAPSGAAGVPVTYAKDQLRTGWYRYEPGLSTTAVQRDDFGERWDSQVNGQVYAQPLVVGNRVLVATEDNWIYSFDARTGQQVWGKQLPHTNGQGLVPFKAEAQTGCSDLAPNVGVTGTPVVDGNTMYLLAKGYADNVADNNMDPAIPLGTPGFPTSSVAAHEDARYWIYSIDITTGNNKYPPRQVPQFLAADNPAGQPDANHARFKAFSQIQRTGLIMTGGRIYAGFSGHCGGGAFHGWVVGFNPASSTNPVPTMWSSTSGIFANGGGIWMSGSAPMSNGANRFYLASGNAHGGKTPAGTTAVPADACGNCVLRFDVQSNGKLKATQFFSPNNANTLDANDSDLGAGGLTELVNKDGSPRLFNGRQVIVSAGKEGYVYLLDASALGGFRQGAGGSDKVLGRVGRYGGVWSKPSVWPGDGGGWVYIPTASPATSGGVAAHGSTGYLQAYKIGTNGLGNPTLTRMTDDSKNTAAKLGFGSSPPVITSNSGIDGSAVVWVVKTNGGDGTDATLNAYSAVPSAGKMLLIKSFPIGTASKFASPTAGPNLLYVATRDGHLKAFGTPAALVGSGIVFTATKIGATSTVNAIFQAQQGIHIDSVTVSGSGFTRGTCTKCANSDLGSGATLSFPVSFRPASTGQKTGTIVVNTNAGQFTFPLRGVGLAAAALPTASPASVNFGSIAVNQTSAIAVTINNPGATTATVQGVDKPAAPFGLSGIPANGTTIAPGGSRSLTVSFGSSATGNYASSFRVRLSTGTVTVKVSGAVRTPGRLTFSTVNVDTGGVQLGSGAQGLGTFRITNSGQLPLAITLSKAPAPPFTAITPLPEGTTLAAGASRDLKVGYTPTAAGTQQGTWLINGNSGGTSTRTTVNLYGVGFNSLPGGASFLRTINPVRLVNTASTGGPLAAHQTREVAAGSRLPDGASTVAVNLTVVNPAAAGSLTAFNCDLPKPATPNVAFAKGQTASNLALVELAGSGNICLSSTAATNVLVDADGYGSTQEGLRFTPVTQGRIYNSYSAGGYVHGGETRQVTVAGHGLPTWTDTVLVNVTASAPAANGSLTVFPCGTAKPGASNVTFSKGVTTSGLVPVRVGTSSRICVAASQPTHLIVDLQGSFRGPSVGGNSYLVGTLDKRALDTRISGGSIAAGTTRTVSRSQLGVPASATSVMVNVTALGPLSTGSVTVYPCGTTRPGVYSVTFPPGGARANLVTSQLKPGDGRLCIYSTATTQLSVDTLAWFA